MVELLDCTSLQGDGQAIDARSARVWSCSSVAMCPTCCIPCLTDHVLLFSIQCFDTVGSATGRAFGL